MSIDIIQEILSYLIIFPAALTCLFPMKNKIKFSFGRNMFHIFFLLTILIILAIIIDNNFDTNYNSVFLPMLLILFLAYHYSLRVHISKSLSIFLFSTAIFSFACNVANGIDAYLYPTSDINHISFEATVIQLLFGVAASIILYYPLSKYGSFLIDKYDNNIVWYGTALVSIIFLIINLSFVPNYYETLQFHNAGRTYWLVLSLCLILLVALSITFYFIVRGFLDAMKIKEQNIILSQQEKEFLIQQKYLESSAKARHDFRQSIHVLKGLANEGNIFELKKYLDKYEESLPEKKTKTFCKNPALNAVLNYYFVTAEDLGVKTDFVINMPLELPIDEVDFCNVVGNILENAVSASSEVSSENRYVKLNISYLYDSEIYIVSSNSFDSAKKKKQHNTYKSTVKPSEEGSMSDTASEEPSTDSSLTASAEYKIPTGLKGSGIGLQSIKATAEYYDGSAEFFEKDSEFNVNVMMKGR